MSVHHVQVFAQSVIEVRETHIFIYVRRIVNISSLASGLIQYTYIDITSVPVLTAPT